MDMDLDPDLDVDEPPRKKRGRPRKVSTVTKQEYITDDDPSSTEERSDDGFGSLFDESVLKSITKVRVIRRDPNEGVVGYLEDPTHGEEEIRARWGGSTYTLQAVNIKGQVCKVTTLRVAGDPIFMSQAAEIQWRRSRGLPPGSTAASAAAAEKGMSTQELMMFLQTIDEKRRSEEREHAAKIRQLELEAADRARRETAEAADKSRRDDEERERRRAKEDEERDRRRRLDDEERENRRRREQGEAEARQQQFMQQTITMIQQSSNQALQFVKATSAEHGPNTGGAPIMEAVKMVVAIKEAFANDSPSEGDGDPLSMVIKHGGEWLNGIGNAVSGAIREVKGGGAPGQQTQQPAMPALAALPSGNPLFGKVEILAAKLAAKGHNPEAALSAIVDSVIRDVDNMPQANKQSVASGPVPFVHSPGTVAQVNGTAPQAPPAVVQQQQAKRNVVRLQFGRAN